MIVICSSSCNCLSTADLNEVYSVFYYFMQVENMMHEQKMNKYITVHFCLGRGNGEGALRLKG